MGAGWAAGWTGWTAGGALVSKVRVRGAKVGTAVPPAASVAEALSGETTGGLGTASPSGPEVEAVEAAGFWSSSSRMAVGTGFARLGAGGGGVTSESLSSSCRQKKMGKKWQKMGVRTQERRCIGKGSEKKVLTLEAVFLEGAFVLRDEALESRFLAMVEDFLEIQLEKEMQERLEVWDVGVSADRKIFCGQGKEGMFGQRKVMEGPGRFWGRENCAMLGRLDNLGLVGESWVLKGRESWVN